MVVLKLIGYVLVLVATIPVFGFLVTGSPRQGWELTKRWARATAFLAVIGAVAGGIVLMVIPPPG